MLLQIVERRKLRDDAREQTEPIRDAERSAGLLERQQAKQFVTNTLN